MSDDVYAYEGLHSQRMFPPSMPSFNPVNNDPEVSNGFGTQGQPNAEKRPLACDERAIYEEALQVHNFTGHCGDHICFNCLVTLIGI